MHFFAQPLFIKTIKGHRYETLFLIDLFTGMRQSEIIGLTWDCLQGDTIYLYRQLQRIDGKHIFTPLKNDKTRRIIPAPMILEKLHEHKRKQQELQAFSGTAWNNNENFVFTNELGEHLKHGAIYKSFKRIMQRIDMPLVRFHDLRHSYAVAALKSGDNVKSVQENLGHHSAAFTLDVYGHVTDEMKRDSATRMNNFFKSVSTM